MTIEQLQKDMMAAMKAHDKERKDAISSLVSAEKCDRCRLQRRDPGRYGKQHDLKRTEDCTGADRYLPEGQNRADRRVPEAS